ncbi:MAG: hypothetical protein FJY36_02490 [Betaproteobacteria bacterium]|nr:hypothetical protein [Betaproteobacteria bacterium]
MNPFPIDSDGACLSPDGALRLNQALAALDAQARVLHLWHPWRQALDAARDAVLQTLRERGERTQVYGAGDLLPLLHTLNTLIADSLRAAPLPTAQQLGVWVIDEVQALPAPHVDLIERILSYFPELPLRLVLLSQTPLAPIWPQAASLLAVDWCERAPAEWTPEPDVPRARGGHARLMGGLGAAALLALAAALGWWSHAEGLWEARQPVAAPAAELSAAPASGPALGDASAASDAASGAATMASEAALPVASAAASSAAPALPVPPAPPVASLAASVPMAAASAAAPTPVVGKGAQRSASQAWVQALPEGSWLVLHGQFAHAREAEAFKAAEPVLANARIVQAVWVSGQPARFGVLTGPFRSPERVRNHLLRLPWREQARSLDREALLALLKP